MNSTLTGKVLLTTTHANPELAGPHTLDLKWPLVFEDQKTKVDAERFPQLKVKDDPGIVVIRDEGGRGSFNPDTGALRIPITLRVDYPFGFATIELELTTEGAGGSRVDKDGKVTLVASGTFDDDNVLEGVDCSLSITGDLDPNPRN